jgi:hypothetical protein
MQRTKCFLARFLYIRLIKMTCFVLLICYATHEQKEI